VVGRKREQVDKGRGGWGAEKNGGGETTETTKGVGQQGRKARGGRSRAGRSKKGKKKHEKRTNGKLKKGGGRGQAEKGRKIQCRNVRGKRKVKGKRPRRRIFTTCKDEEYWGNFTKGQRGGDNLVLE